ncbi:MAG TPA: fumarate reductase subunit C [bacterium]|nr:fumarate reductase subunit C [bacterium]
MTGPYHQPMSPTWWLRNRAYFLFMLRELTSVFIAGYAILLLILLYQLNAGRDAYQSYLRFLAAPGMVAFHVIALAAALFHTVTWFNLTPKVLVVRMGGRHVPASVIAGVNYVAWIVISALVAWIVLRG